MRVCAVRLPFLAHEVFAVSGTTALVVLVLAVVVLLIVIAIAARSRRAGTRGPALPLEVRSRYAQAWAAIEARFVDHPAAAVQEADRLALSMLRDRGADVQGNTKLPRELLEARQAAESNEGQSGTEGMRKAMVRYQRIVEDGVGESLRRPSANRTEVAS
jgi:hypothetical protein